MEKINTTELIVCAAIKFRITVHKKDYWGIKYVVLPMVRHYSPDGHKILDMINNCYPNAEEIEQGFITNKSRFVDRKEALEIAKANKQIKFGIGYEPDELYSEMLY